MTDDAYSKGWNAAIERAAEIAGDPRLHSASATQEREFANRLCPKIAKAIRAAAVTSGQSS